MKPKVFIILLLFFTSVRCTGQGLLQLRGYYDWPLLVAQIDDQTGMHVHNSMGLIWDTSKIWLEMDHVTVDSALAVFFVGMRVQYRIAHGRLTVGRKPGKDTALFEPLYGVVYLNGLRVSGAEVSDMQGKHSVLTDLEGRFRLPCYARMTAFSVHYTGGLPDHFQYAAGSHPTIHLRPDMSLLQTVVVHLPHDKETRRTSIANTGETSEEPNGIPIPSSWANACQRPGVYINSGNGIPFSNENIMIRGTNSIAGGRGPMLLVDGVLMAGSLAFPNQIGTTSAIGANGFGVLHSFDPAQLRNVAIYKDATATSNYGSRGANGVILFTLPDSIQGGHHLDLERNVGYAQSFFTGKMMDTRAFLDLRETALKNDGAAINAASLPELYAWGNARSTDHRKEILGNQALLSDSRISYYTRWKGIQILLAGNYDYQSTTFPGPTGDSRKALLGHFNWLSGNQRWHVQGAGQVSWDQLRLPGFDPTIYITEDANTPSPYDAAGHFVWQQGGASFINIPASLLNTYRGDLLHRFGNIQLSYELLPGLVLKGQTGGDELTAAETNNIPVAAEDPATNPIPSLIQSSSRYYSKMSALDAAYSFRSGFSDVRTQMGLNVQEEGYSNTTNGMVYRYAAFQGALKYKYKNRIMADLSFCRDGSSRLGPAKRWGNFGAIGVAWVFSDLSFFKSHLPWMTLGKLRGSYGITGNDLNANGSYMAAYQATTASRGYGGQQGTNPISLANPNMTFEINHQCNVGMDLNFFGDKVELSWSAFHNFTSNQLLLQNLSYAAGVPAVVQNLPARVVNNGIEAQLTLVGIHTKHWQVRSTVSFTMERNFLERMNSLSSTAYANLLQIGQSVNVYRGFLDLGVDPRKGLNQFADLNKDGVLNNQDKVALGDPDPKVFGSWRLSCRWRSIELGFSVQGVKQKGLNPLYYYYAETPPGMAGPEGLSNVPAVLGNFWRKPGDKAAFQQPTATPGTAAANTIPDLTASSFSVVDASLIRLRELAVVVYIPADWQPGGIKDASCYVRAENVFTMTRYAYADPETRDPFAAPSLRSFVVGVHFFID